MPQGVGPIVGEGHSLRLNQGPPQVGLPDLGLLRGPPNGSRPQQKPKAQVQRVTRRSTQSTNPGSQTQTGSSEEDTRSKDPGTTTRSINSAPLVAGSPLSQNSGVILETKMATEGTHMPTNHACYCLLQQKDNDEEAEAEFS